VYGGTVTPPMRIDIPSIGVSSSLLQLGLNADRTMQVPSNFSLAGWYDGSAQPGDWGKPTVILGHVDSSSGPAVFYRLKTIQPGADVWVLRGDQTWVRFVVDRVAQYPKSGFPTKLVYAPRPGRTLRLITCGGAFDHSTGHYVDNIVAFAHIA
jgi:Sortase domain